MILKMMKICFLGQPLEGGDRVGRLGECKGRCPDESQVGPVAHQDLEEAHQDLAFWDEMKMMFEVFFSSLSSCVLVEFDDDDDDDVVMMKQEEAMVVAA